MSAWTYTVLSPKKVKNTSLYTEFYYLTRVTSYIFVHRKRGIHWFPLTPNYTLYSGLSA